MSSSRSPQKNLAAQAPSLETARDYGVLRTKPLLRYVLAIGLCAFPLGWDLGTTGNLIDLPSFRARLNVTSHAAGLLISVFNVGCIAACATLFFYRMTHKVGHLVMFRVGILFYLLGSFCTLCSLLEGRFCLPFHIFGRMLQGVSAGGSCVIGPVFISHLCTFSKNRIVFVALFQIMIGAFVFLGNCFFIYSGQYSEHVFYVVTLVVPSFALACSLYLPESPRDTVVFRDPKRIKKSLQILLKDCHRAETWVSALSMLKPMIPVESPGAKTPKLNVSRLMTCCFFLFLQQMTGANFLFYFGKSMFDSLIVMNGSVKISGLLLSACNLGGSVISGFLVRRSGARKPLFYGSITLSCLLCIFATLGTVSRLRNSSQFGVPMLVTSCLFLFVFAMSWGPCTPVLSMEISRADGRIMSCSVICGWVTNILVVSVFPILVDKWGLGTMYIFCFFTVMSIWATRKDRCVQEAEEETQTSEI